MPRVLITTEPLRDAPGPHADLLREAGFELSFPVNPELGRGLGTEEETIHEMVEVDAVLAGSEFLTAKVLEALPRLRVIARTGVGYDRVDVPAATQQRVAVTITPTANPFHIIHFCLNPFHMQYSFLFPVFFPCFSLLSFFAGKSLNAHTSSHSLLAASHAHSTL